MYDLDGVDTEAMPMTMMDQAAWDSSVMPIPTGTDADGTSIAVVAGTTDHSALPSSTEVSTEYRASTRVLEDDGARSSGTEIGGARSISVEDSSDIVRSGPRADLPQLGSTASADSGEQGEAQQGRVRMGAGHPITTIHDYPPLI